jgi:predicted Zn-dependent peptidase
MISNWNTRWFGLISKYIRPNHLTASLVYGTRMKPIEVSPEEVYMKDTLLDNGVKVITESLEYPCCVHLGLLYPIGARSEPPGAQGVLQALKNTYLKPNEEQNFLKLQTLGSELFMDFDYEFVYYSGYCLPEDTLILLNILKSITSYKRTAEDQNFINLRHKMYWEQREDITIDRINKEIWISNGFEGNLSNSLGGSKDFVPSVDCINKFTAENLKNNFIICASGVTSHEDFVELAESVFGDSEAGAKTTKILEPTNFISKESKILCENDINYLTISFQGVSITDPNYLGLELIRCAIQSEFKSKTTKASNSYTKPANISFMDTGLFGITAVFHSFYSNDAVNLIFEQIKYLCNINEKSFALAKINLKLELFEAYENKQLRLENMARGYYITNKLHTLADSFNFIDNLNIHDIKNLCYQLFSSQPNILYLGRNAKSSMGLEKFNLLIKKIL